MTCRVLGLLLIGCSIVAPAGIQAEEPASDGVAESRTAEHSNTLDGAAGAYRTPRAGEALEIEIFGRHVSVPERDRSHTNAVNLGSVIVAPNIGGQTVIPFAALYTRHYWEDGDRWLRAVLVGVHNEAIFIDSAWNDSGFVYGASWFNDTVPLGRTEVLRGRDVEDSEVKWGQLYGGVGFGWQTPVSPGYVDNKFLTWLSYDLGYFYADRTSNTGDRMVLPPDTPLHRLSFEIRYDAFERNLMELFHEGQGLFLRARYTHRVEWSDHGVAPSVQFKESDTQDFVQLFGFGAMATGVPFLSERHRFTLSAGAGWMPEDAADRFSAFRIGGGPPSGESASIDRAVLPGALFDQVIMQRFVAGNIEYRYEVFPFLFFHLRGSFGLGNIPTDIDPVTGEVDFELEHSSMLSVAVTSGFFWKSEIYLEYAYNGGEIIRPESGHGVVVGWSKSF